MDSRKFLDLTTVIDGERLTSINIVIIIIIITNIINIYSNENRTDGRDNLSLAHNLIEFN